jgi:hypothetical protein
MNKSIIGISLALTLIGGFALASDATSPSSSLRSGGNASATATRTDACPYYPSPVFCRVGSTDRAGS